jgi:ribose-phosphate pyrophosphokinase
MSLSYRGRATDVAEELKKNGVTHAISLGRRAPMHRMHVDCLKEMIEAGVTPVVMIGSTNGPGTELFDPLRNPMTAEQQKEQVQELFAARGWPQPVVLELPDHPDDTVWMQNLLDTLKNAGINPAKSVMHFRGKAADAEKQSEKIKPLGAYAQSLQAAGIGVWQSYNRNAEDDHVCATSLRGLDLGGPLPADFVLPVHIRTLAKQARRDNPDGVKLDAAGLPLTMLDLTLARLWTEAGIKTATLLAAAAKNGPVTFASLTQTIRDNMHKAQTKKPLLVLGNSLSSAIRDTLSQSDDFDLIPAKISVYQSGEPYVGFQTDVKKIKDAEIFVVQSTAAPVAENVQHLLEMVHTLKFYGAAKVKVVMPFAAFGRQDRGSEHHLNSVAVDLFARQLKAAGTDDVITLSLHSDAARGYFRQAFGDHFQNLSLADFFAGYFKSQPCFDAKNICVGAPDGAGKPNDEGQARARRLAKAISPDFNDAAMFFIGKEHVAASETKVVSFKGDVAGKDCIVIDDMADGGSTLINAARILKERGAKTVTCCITHGILTPAQHQSALERLLLEKKNGVPLIDKLVLTDTVPEAVAKSVHFTEHMSHNENWRVADHVTVLSVGEVLLKSMQSEKSESPALQPSTASSRLSA